MPVAAPSAPDSSLVPCPHCGRRFNENAAERHIPKCNDIKAKVWWWWWWKEEKEEVVGTRFTIVRVQLVRVFGVRVNACFFPPLLFSSHVS